MLVILYAHLYTATSLNSFINSNGFLVVTLWFSTYRITNQKKDTISLTKEFFDSLLFLII